MINSRIDAFRKKLSELNIESALIINRENRMYLSGFTGSNGWLLMTQEKAILFTDFRYEQQSHEQAPLFEIKIIKSSLLEAVKEIVSDLSIKNIGLEDSHLTYKEYLEFYDKFTSCTFSSIDNEVEKLRRVKDENELEMIKRAVEIADKAFTHTIKRIKPGVSELEIAAELEYSMKLNGASGASFETIVASGYRAAMPHGVASEKKVELGDVITMDYGAIYNHYCSDITRTVFLGEPKPELTKIYNIVLEAQLKAEAEAHADKLGSEVDAVARNYIKSHGYGEYFGHGLGHGLGLEIHEQPRLSVSGDLILQNSMTVTVEPGLYISGLGGVRIEDTIVINDKNPIILTQTTKERIIL